jgi:ABC-2 type transport system permease protein
MNSRIVATLVKKDVALFSRNKFFVVVTALGLVAYIVIYFVMPASVDETLEIGLYAPGEVPPVLEDVQGQGLEIEEVDSEEALRQAVVGGRYVAGVALPADFMDRLGSDQRPSISVYFALDTPDEVKKAVESLIGELAYIQTGQPLPVEISQEIVGVDMAGRQIPPRDRLRPVFAVLLLITETLFLATLISEEVERRTIQALLVTPAKVRDLLGAKGVVGVSLAFSEALLFMAIVGGLATQPLPIVVALLLGGVLVTGISFLLATAGKDMMSVMAWGIPVVVVMIIPAVTVLFPGAMTGWIKVIPSYYLVDTVNQAANFGGGWGDVWVNLLALTAFGLAFFWIGSVVLVRRFR